MVSRVHTARAHLLHGFEHGFEKEKSYTKAATRQHVRNVVMEINALIWPHWLRDQRSWHLSKELGFDAYLLKAWFDWSSLDTTTRYAGRREDRDIMEHLGVEYRPEGREN